MALSATSFRTLLCFVLLIISSFSHANTTQNIYSMTASILGYVKWNTTTPSLCVIDNQALAQSFDLSFKQKKLNFKVVSLSNTELNAQHCDAVFFTESSPTTEQRLINHLKTPPALSFSNNNSDCEIGSVFCLYTSKQGRALFKVNLDSLARTKVHIDPRVLLLAKNSE